MTQKELKEMEVLNLNKANCLFFSNLSYGKTFYKVKLDRKMLWVLEIEKNSDSVFVQRYDIKKNASYSKHIANLTSFFSERGFISRGEIIHMKELEEAIRVIDKYSRNGVIY